MGLCLVFLSLGDFGDCFLVVRVLKSNQSITFLIFQRNYRI